MLVPPQGLPYWRNKLKWLFENVGYKNKEYDSNLDGLIDNSDKVDGYDAGTGANNILVLDSNGLVPLGNIPVLDWSKLQFPGVRQEILQYFDNPKILIATSSMLELLNSAEKAGANTSGISATSKELTIPGGTSTASGNTWVYISFPYNVTKVYYCVRLCSVNAVWVTTEAFAGSDPTVSPGSTGDTEYHISLHIPATAQDFIITKVINGTATILGYESTDLSYNTYYNIEVLISNPDSIIKVWRDGALKFNLTPDTTNLPSFTAFRIRVVDLSTTTAQQGKVTGPIVIIYE